MAITYVGERAAYNPTAPTANAAQSFTLASSCTTGNTALLFFAGNRSGTMTAVSVTDSRGNTWTTDLFPGDSAVEFIVASTNQNVGTLVSGHTITVTATGATWTSEIFALVEEFSGQLVADKTSHTTTAGPATSMSAGTTAATADASEVAVACWCWNTDLTGLTGAAAYTHFTTFGQTRNNAPARSMMAEYQILSATGTQSATATVTNSATYSAGIVTYKAAASAPVNTVAPAVTGTAQVGSTLTTDNGTWTGSPTGYSYQWTRNGSNIASATASTYTLVDADDATTVLCVVTATNASGSASANSNSNSITEPVATNSVAPVASGTAAVNSTVSATTGTWANMGGTVATYAYQWQDSANGTTGWANVTGATSSNYTIAVGELNKYLRCNVTATNTGGTSSATSSNVLGPVAAAATTSYNLGLAANGGRFLRMKGIR